MFCYAASGVSGSGLGALLNLTEGQGTGGIADLLQNVMQAQQGQSQSADAQLGQQLNLQQLAAFRQAQQLA